MLGPPDRQGNANQKPRGTPLAPASKAGRGDEDEELTRTRRQGCRLRCWWEGKLVRPLRKAAGNFIKTLKMEQPFGPAIPFLGLYPKKPQTVIYKDAGAPVFAAALLAPAQTWERPHCPRRARG